ncbi:MAG: T9SS type A sorting domain-containing protein, partial [candidate division WOR-3 bacterium]
LNIELINVTDNAKLSALEIRREEGGLEEPAKIPSDYFLGQNYPNPFSPATRIQYGLPRAAHVRIDLYNVSGQRVDVIIDKKQSAGYHSVDFYAENLATGIYFYTIEANDFSQTRKMILVK